MKNLSNIIRKAERLIIWSVAVFFTLNMFVFAKVEKSPKEYNPTRIMTPSTISLNTAYQPNIYRDCFVVYSPMITSSLTLSGGQSGNITMQISPDNITYTTMGTQTNNSTGGLTIGLSLVNAQGTQMFAYIPRGYYFKLVTSGTASFSLASGWNLCL